LLLDMASDGPPWFGGCVIQRLPPWTYPAPPRFQETLLSSLLGTSLWAAETAFADSTTLSLASALAGSLYAKAGSQDGTRQYITRPLIVLSHSERHLWR
jgi:hypothetical protein